MIVAVIFLCLGGAVAWLVLQQNPSRRGQLDTRENELNSNLKSQPSSSSSRVSQSKLKPHVNLAKQCLPQPVLTEREQEILVLLAHGYTNKEIAASIQVSPNTVKTHCSRIFSKLEVSNRTQAVSEAKLMNLIE
ncbi:response regulator transcription factor [Aliikangiella sp. IMCC44632]